MRTNYLRHLANIIDIHAVELDWLALHLKFGSVYI